MRESDLLALAEELEQTDLAGWAQRVQNILGNFVFLEGRPDMAIPLRYIEHLEANGARGRGKTKSDPAIATQLLAALRAQGYQPIRGNPAAFDVAFRQYLAYYGDIATRIGRGNASSRENYKYRYTFWLPADVRGPSREAVIAAMDRLAAGEQPEGFGTARVWFVRHPETGVLHPAKSVWGLANALAGREFTAHQARDGLRKLGFDLPGPDQPAAEIAESPESLAALPLHMEGAERQVTRSVRERSSEARREAEAHWRELRGGLICEGCEIDFGKAYGPRGEGFMHFHHLSPIAKAEGARQVNGAAELVPLCPNCHAIVHRGEDLLDIEALRALLGKPKRPGA